jgi:hypothetical protein
MDSEVSVFDLITAIGPVLLAPLIRIMLRNPKGWLARSLLSNLGPSLDARSMSRGDCIRAALGFVAIGAGACWVCCLMVTIDNRTAGSLIETLPAQILLFALVLFAMMGFGGALYLLARAPFRPRGGLAVPDSEP